MSLARIPIEPPARNRVPVRLIYALVIGLAALGAWQLVVAVQNVRVTASRSADT